MGTARELNRRPALVVNARRLRMWALGGDERLDRLASARGGRADLAARRLAALRGETPGLVGEIGLSALQAWQELAERRGRGRGTVDVAILFTDLVDFSSWALRAGDELALVLLSELSEAIEPPILDNQGEVVKRLGDGLMGAFPDASSALVAACEMNRRASAVAVGGYRPCLRTGIHVGRPRRIRGDYLGIDVNIAARVAEQAQPGEILLSERAWNSAECDGEVRVAPRVLSAKGVPSGLVVYAAAQPSAVSR